MKKTGAPPKIDPARQPALVKEWLTTDIGMREMAAREGVSLGAVQYMITMRRAEIDAELAQEQEEVDR